MNSRCVLASCRAGLWSSFKHLAGFLKLKRMPWRSSLTQLFAGTRVEFLCVEPFEHQASDRQQGLQEVTLLWNSVGFGRVGASGASASG